MSSTPKELYLAQEQILTELNYNQMWYVLWQKQGSIWWWAVMGKTVCHTALVQSSLEPAWGPRAVPEKVYLLSLSFEWEQHGLLKEKKKTVITTTTIIKNICSACTVCQGPFILRAFDHSRSQIFTALHRCCYYSYFKRSKLKLGVSVTCQR